MHLTTRIFLCVGGLAALVLAGYFAHAMIMPMRGALSPWFDPAAWKVLRGSFTFNMFMEGTRYFVGVVLIWLALHVLLKQRIAHRLIAGWPTVRDIRREFAYSLSSLLIFAALGMGVFALVITGHIVIYSNPARYGWTWLILSLPLMIIWHDVYFYWTHRLLHTPWLFRRVHGVHHRSRNPSPFAAYAFHPIEAVINGLVTPIALLVVPLHGAVILLFGVHQILRNAHGHAAVEIMPAAFVRHWFWAHFTTTTHHHLHHETAQGNYGLWFTWWDRWRGTERKDYLMRFDSVASPRLSQPTASVTDG